MASFCVFEARPRTPIVARVGAGLDARGDAAMLGVESPSRAAAGGVEALGARGTAEKERER